MRRRGAPQRPARRGTGRAQPQAPRAGARRGFPPAPTGEERRRGPRYLTGRVGVQHFAFDDEPELLPVPLALLTPAEVAADGGALSGGGHLAEGSKRGGQGAGGGHGSDGA